MVLTARRLGALLAACGAIVALAGQPRPSMAQEPTPAPAPAVPPPRYFADLFRGSRGLTGPGRAWIGIGLACSRCSYQSEGKTVRRWDFSEPPTVTMVERGGPADQAGLRAGDTLVAVDGQTLTSAEGGEAFANLRPGVTVRLAYRREGRDRTVSVTPVENPLSRQQAAADSLYRAAMRAYERSTVEAQRELERTLGERQRAQRDIQGALEEVRQNRGKVLDSVSTQRMREALEQARRALETQRNHSLFMPFPPVAPDAPAAPSPPVVSPGAGAPDYSVAPRGGLRYSGRLGEALIEARRPGRVMVVETGDSEVVLTGGDLSVRVALSARGAVGRAGVTATAGFAVARSASGDEAAGVQGVVANPRLAAALGATSGVLVLDVQPRSHADSLGIRPGDVLVALNGNPVVSVATERTVPKRYRAATTAGPSAQSAVVVRARERRTLELAAPRAPTPRPRR